MRGRGNMKNEYFYKTMRRILKTLEDGIRKDYPREYMEYQFREFINNAR